MLLLLETVRSHVVLVKHGLKVCWSGYVIDDERLYGFARVDTGDEMSKRVKFVLVTWVGVNVGALKRAKMSIDKSVVKTVIAVRNQSDICRVIMIKNIVLEFDAVVQLFTKTIRDLVVNRQARGYLNN